MNDENVSILRDFLNNTDINDNWLDGPLFYNKTQGGNKNMSREELGDQLIKVKATLGRVLFPKYPKVLGEGDNTYGIVSWEIVEVIEGEPQVNEYGNITVKGDYNSTIDFSKTYNILAREVVDSNWGLQYSLIYWNEDVDLRTINNQKTFLLNVFTPTQVDELFKVFDNPIEVIANHDEKELQKVKGIGPVNVKKIIKKYEEKKDLSAIYLKLDKIGLKSGMVNRLVRVYKEPMAIVQVINENPYRLAEEVDGIGFKTADDIAMKNGLSPKSVLRIKSYIKYYLNEQGNNGHSYVTAGELTTNIFNGLNGKDECYENYLDSEGNIIGNNLQDAIQELIDEKVIGIEGNENRSRRRVYLMKYYNLEKKIAENLKRLLTAKNDFKYYDWREKVAELEDRQGFNFSDEQLKGIKLGLDNQVCLITGYAGSGKSSLVSGILAALEDYPFAQTCLSGKGAARLQEVTGVEGMTIHRLLNYRNGNFEYNSSLQLPYDIIILDEVSMVGGEIFLTLIESIRSGSKLIMLGDPGQLESIGSLNLITDMLNSSLIPNVRLKQVHRQAKKSGVLTSAYDVRNNVQLFDDVDFEGVETRGELQDMTFDILLKKDRIKEDVLVYFQKYYNSDLVNKNIMDIQIVSPVKTRGEACVEKLNLAIQQLINPVNPEDNKPKHKINRKKDENGEDRSYYIQKNDKIMCIKNNYHVLNLRGEEVSIYNGWTGIVDNIMNNFIYLRFPLLDEIVIMDEDDIADYLVLGYASTVHKCVTGDSWILIQDDNGHIKNIQIQNFDEKWIGKYKVWNGYYFEKPDKFYSNSLMKTIKIITKRKYCLQGLYNHEIYVLNKNGEIEKKELQNLEKEDFILINKNLELEKNVKNYYLPLPKQWFNLGNLDKRTIIYDLPKELTKDFAVFLGMMVADGTVYKNKIALGKKEYDYLDRFCNLIRKIFGYDAHIRNTKGKMGIVEVNSIFISNFCKNIDGLQPNKKDIPDIILSSSLEIQASFLSALFEDGYINIKKDKFDHIELSSKNKNIIDKVRIMLLNFGIISSYLEKYNGCKGNKYKYYCLFIYKKEAIIFKEKIGYLTKLNQEKIKYCLKEEAKPTSPRISIPYIYQKVEDIIIENNLIKYDLRVKYILNNLKKRKTITENALNIIFSICEKNNIKDKKLIYLKELVDNYYFEKIEKIEEKDLQTTYCFNMPETHSFVVNGILSSNCQGSDFKVVIGVLDYSTPPSMLTCQLVYTMLTRAKKHCVLVAQNGALRKAIQTNYVSDKRTFLPEFLEEIEEKIKEESKKNKKEREHYDATKFNNPLGHKVSLDTGKIISFNKEDKNKND